MSDKKKRIVGEGGAHVHTLLDPTRTGNDGMHKHLFFINDRILMTELDGDHSHIVNIEKDLISLEMDHNHKVIIPTEDEAMVFKTSATEPHTHELQVDSTTLSGTHIHVLELGDSFYVSMLPKDLIEEVEEASKSYPAFKSINLKRSADCLEMDFLLIKKLNKKEFSEVLKESITKVLLKSLGQLSNGMHIQSLVLSRERFLDIGSARRFVMDNNIRVRASEERPEVFTFLVASTDKFQEATLQRVRITEGVEAIVGFLSDDVASLEDPMRNEVIDGVEEDTFVENAPIVERHSERVESTLDSMKDPNQSGGRGMKLSEMDDLLSNLESTYVTKKLKTPEEVLNKVSTTLQTLIFSKSKFSKSEAISWAKSHDMRHDKVDETKNSFRLRQRDPGDFIKGSFRTITITAGIKGVIGKLKTKKSRHDKKLKKKKSKKTEIMKMQIFKIDEDRRIVAGPLLVPEQVDLQNDIVSADEIEKASHDYMIKLTFSDDPDFLLSVGLSTRADRGFMHKDFSKKIAVVESYLAPVDFEVGEGRVIKKGTWMVVVKIFDDEIWGLIKAGKITGFSIGGRSKVIHE